MALPKEAWMKLAIDFIGPISSPGSNDVYGIVLVDYYTKWPEVRIVKKVTTDSVIAFLEEIFAREGIPEILVSDNGVQLRSHKMQQFLRNSGVKHCRVALHHPMANGQVERFNRVIKETVQLTRKTELPWKKVLLDCLASYRMTPHSVTGYSPFELLRGRKCPSRLVPWWLQDRYGSYDVDINRDDIKRNVETDQGKLQPMHESRQCRKEIQVGQKVRIKLPGVIKRGAYMVGSSSHNRSSQK